MSIISCLQIRSQLAEQLLEYLKKVQEDADKRLMPGRGEDMPLYFAGSDVRTPRGVYVWPDVVKHVRKAKSMSREEEQEDSEFNSKQDPKGQAATRPGVMNQDKPSEKERRYREDTVAQRVPWLNELKRSGRKRKFRALVRGAPGQGKSWLTLQTSARQAAEAHAALKSRTARPDDLVLPVTLRLADLLKKCETLKGNATQRSVQVREAIHSLLLDEGCGLHAARFLADCAGTKQIWLYLDALDETPRGESLNTLFAAIDPWPGPVVVTTRPYAADHVAGHTSWKQHPAYNLADLSQKQAQTLINHWFSGMPHQDVVRDRLLNRIRRGDYRLISENPLMLTLLCATAENSGLPDQEHVTRGQLYEVILNDIFKQVPEPQPDEKHDAVDFAEIAPLIEILAWRMADQNPEDPWLKRGDLLDLIDSWVEEKKLEYPRGTLLATFEKARLLIPQTITSHECLAFAHRDLGNFLAGAHLARTVNLEGWKKHPAIETNDPDVKYRVHDWLCAAIWNPSTEPIVGFGLGAMTNPLPVLEALEATVVVSPGGQNLGHDVLGYRLRALCRCLVYIYTREAHPRVRQCFDEYMGRVTSLLLDCIQGSGSLFINRLIEGESQAIDKSIDSFCVCAARHSHSVFTLELLDLLSHEEWNTSQAAKWTLSQAARCGVDMSAILAPTIGLLDNDVYSVRYAAATVLVQAAEGGADVSDAIDKLISMLVAADDDSRRFVATVLGRAATSDTDASDALEKLISLIIRCDDRIFDDVVSALYAFVKGHAQFSIVLNRLVDLLYEGNWRLRFVAASMLGQILEDTRGSSVHLNNLIDLLDDQDGRVRFAASTALLQAAESGVDISGAIDKLINLLRDHSPLVLATVMLALSEVANTGFDISRAIDDSIKLFDKDVVTSYMAAVFVGETVGYAAATSDILNRLDRLSSESNWRTRKSAVSALGSAAEVVVDASSIVNRMLKFLADNEPRVRLEAVSALGKAAAVGADISEAIDGLIDCLVSQDRLMRRDAASVLGLAGKNGADISLALNKLKGLLADDDYSVGSAAILAIGLAAEGGNDISRILGYLIESLGSDDSDVCRKAVFGLGRLATSGVDISEANQSLIDLLGDNDPQTRKYAANTLGEAAKHGANVTDGLSILVGLLDDPEARYAAVSALEQAAKAGTDIINAFQGLLDLLRKDDWKVRTLYRGASEVRRASMRAIGNMETAGWRFFDSYGQVEALDMSSLTIKLLPAVE